MIETQKRMAIILKLAADLFNREDELRTLSRQDSDAGDDADAELLMFKACVLQPAMIQIARHIIQSVMAQEDLCGIDAVIDQWLKSRNYNFTTPYPDDLARERQSALGSMCETLVYTAVSAASVLPAHQAVTTVIYKGTGPYGVGTLIDSIRKAGTPIRPILKPPPSRFESERTDTWTS